MSIKCHKRDVSKVKRKKKYYCQDCGVLLKYNYFRCPKHLEIADRESSDEDESYSLFAVARYA